MHPIFKQALNGIIPNSLLNKTYNINELSDASKNKVIKAYSKYPNADGSYNSKENIILGLSEDNVLFDAYGNILQG